MGLDREVKKFTDRYKEVERSVDEKTGSYTAVVLITIGLLGLIAGVVIGVLIP